MCRLSCFTMPGDCTAVPPWTYCCTAGLPMELCPVQRGGRRRQRSVWRGGPRFLPAKRLQQLPAPAAAGPGPAADRGCRCGGRRRRPGRSASPGQGQGPQGRGRKRRHAVPAGLRVAAVCVAGSHHGSAPQGGAVPICGIPSGELGAPRGWAGAFACQAGSALPAQKQGCIGE